MDPNIEERYTKEYWERYFIEHCGATGARIKDDDDGWKVASPDFKSNEDKNKWHGTVQSRMGASGGMVAQYALICPDCGRWFDNGWYQSECRCGKEIPIKWVYP